MRAATCRHRHHRCQTFPPTQIPWMWFPSALGALSDDPNVSPMPSSPPSPALAAALERCYDLFIFVHFFGIFFILLPAKKLPPFRSVAHILSLSRCRLCALAIGSLQRSNKHRNTAVVYYTTTPRRPTLEYPTNPASFCLLLHFLATFCI